MVRHRADWLIAPWLKDRAELFPAMYLVKKWFIRRGTEERRAFDRIKADISY